MKIVILTVDHLYANKLVKDLINEYGNDIKLIVEPTSQLKGKRADEILFKYLKTSGFYYTASQAIKLAIYKVLSRLFTSVSASDNKFFNYKRLAKEKGVKTLLVEDTNSKTFLARLRRIKPDLVVSVLFSHILKRDLLRIPKKGVINIHPAYLPNYKGISPVFWALANKERYVGVSVHFIDEGIDTGGVIARKKLKIDKEDTEHSLYWKLVKIGSPMLIESIRKVFRGKVKTISNKKGSYFSFPTKEAVRRFRRLGKSFFNFIFYVLF